MKKHFQEPELELVLLCSSDIMATSGLPDVTDLDDHETPRL